MTVARLDCAPRLFAQESRERGRFFLVFLFFREEDTRTELWSDFTYEYSRTHARWQTVIAMDILFILACGGFFVVVLAWEFDGKVIVRPECTHTHKKTTVVSNIFVSCLFAGSKGLDKYLLAPKANLICERVQSVTAVTVHCERSHMVELGEKTLQKHTPAAVANIVMHFGRRT